MQWYIDAWQKYGTFSGRSHRTAFWMFWLFDTIFTFVAAIIDSAIGEDIGVFCLFYTLATIVPYFAVAARRLHDVGLSGWWILVPVVNLVFLCVDSQRGPNRYGPNPKTV